MIAKIGGWAFDEREQGAETKNEKNVWFAWRRI